MLAYTQDIFITQHYQLSENYIGLLLYTIIITISDNKEILKSNQIGTTPLKMHSNIIIGLKDKEHAGTILQHEHNISVSNMANNLTSNYHMTKCYLCPLCYYCFFSK